MQSAEMAQANQFLRSKLDQARCWFHYCSEQAEAMFSSKVATASLPDNATGDAGINLVSNFESLLVEFQSLLIWECPTKSAFALTTFTFFYWVVNFCNFRLIPIIALLFFTYHFYEMWTRYLWPEIRVPTAEIKENFTPVNPNVLSAPEIQVYLAKLKDSVALVCSEIADLRQRSHGTFSFLSITLLTVFYYLGKYIPGVVLVYAIAILLFLTPGFLLHVLPHHVLEGIIDYCNSLAASPNQAGAEATPNCEFRDLFQDNARASLKKEEGESSTATAAASREGSLSPQFNSHFEDNFFARDTAKSKSSSTSDLSDDFEIISDAEMMELK